MILKLFGRNIERFCESDFKELRSGVVMFINKGKIFFFFLYRSGDMRLRGYEIIKDEEGCVVFVCFVFGRSFYGEIFWREI